MNCITTKEHYEKFEAMYDAQRALGFDLIAQANYLIPSKPNKEPLEVLQDLFNKDPNLNNIKLAHFDIWYPINRSTVINCLSYNTCVLKHTMIYKILKCKPIFKD